jgi:hypothetical protein
MAENPADQVTVELTFWHKGKVPGDRVQVRRDELPMWRGFGVPVEDTQDKPADMADQTPEPAAEPVKADEPAAAPATPAKASSNRAK